MTDNHFTCAICKGAFEKGRPHEEAASEALETFGSDVVNNDEMLLVCDDCYKLIDPSNHPIELEITKEIFKQ